MENAFAPEPRLASELATIPPLPFRRGEGQGEGAPFALGWLAAGGACGSCLPPAARERDDGKSLPGPLVARLAVRFSGELYPLLCWRLDFIGGSPSSLSGLAVIMAERACRAQENLRLPSIPRVRLFAFADNAFPVPQSLSTNLALCPRVPLGKQKAAGIRTANLAEAAQVLGIDQATLYRKRKKIGLE